MAYRSLYEMITYIENGTNLHIGVLFFGNYGNKLCELPHKHHIHSSAVCQFFKTKSKQGFKRCFRCRNIALNKALTTKKPFGGLCINGIFEYTHPVIIDGEVSCIIFIGNITQSEENYQKIKSNLSDKSEYADSLERKLNMNDCIIIAELLESHIVTLLKKYSYKNTDTNPLIKNVKNYIYHNLDFDISINHIAKVFHYNKMYLCRIFKKETGMNIKDFINFQRIKKAKEMLENTKEPVISISEKAGFNNVTYFNRLFKSTMNMTPTQYRKSFKN